MQPIDCRMCCTVNKTNGWSASLFFLLYPHIAYNNNKYSNEVIIENSGVARGQRRRSTPGGTCPIGAAFLRFPKVFIIISLH